MRKRGNSSYFSITIRVNAWVKLIHQARLVLTLCTSGASGSSGGGRVVVSTVSSVSTSGSGVGVGQRGGTVGTSSSKSSANRSWLTSEGISALFTSSKGSTLLLELGHRNGGECGSSVVLSLVVVNLVDWLQTVSNDVTYLKNEIHTTVVWTTDG